MVVIEPTVDKLNEPTVMLQIRNVAKAVDKNLNAVNDEMTDIQNQIDQMEDTSARVDALEDDMQTTQQAITEIQQKDTEQDTAIQNNEDGLVTGTELSYANGQLTLKLTREVGELSDVVDVPFFKTVTLIPTSTERAFKLQFTMWDDSIYDTNEFVIPAGGGTDVSVTGVTVEDGNDDNSFKVSIQLSDGTPIDSNDYPFPTQTVSPYPTSATLALSGNTLNLTIGLSNSTNVKGSVDLSPILTGYATQQWVTTALGDYVTEVEITGIQSDLQEQISGLKLSSTNNNMTLNGDSVPIVKNVTGKFNNNNLVVGVNGIESDNIPINIVLDEKTGALYLNTNVIGSFTDPLQPASYTMGTYHISYITLNKVNNLLGNTGIYTVYSMTSYASRMVSYLLIKNTYYNVNTPVTIIKNNLSLPSAPYYMKVTNVAINNTEAGQYSAKSSDTSNSETPITDIIIAVSNTSTTVKVKDDIYSTLANLQMFPTIYSKVYYSDTEPTW